MFKSSSRNNSRVIRTNPVATPKGRVMTRKKSEKEKGISKSFWLKFLSIFLEICFVGVVVYALFFSPLLNIKSVIVNGAQDLKKEDIASVSSDILKQKYFFNTLHRSNLILLNTDEIKTALQDRFKRIESVEITKKFPDKLFIKIKEWESSLVFCSGDQCFVVDSNGKAYARADFHNSELGEQSLLVLRDLSQKNIIQENIDMDSGLINFLENIEDRLSSELNLNTKQEWSTPLLVSGDLRAETTEGWKVYFNYNIGTEKEIEMLKTVLNNSLDDDKRSNLEYVDLRLDNKVYYKLKNAQIAEEEDSVDKSLSEAESKKKKK